MCFITTTSKITLPIFLFPSQPQYTQSDSSYEKNNNYIFDLETKIIEKISANLPITKHLCDNKIQTDRT